MCLTFEKKKKRQNNSLIYPRECEIVGVMGNDEADLATVDIFRMVSLSNFHWGHF